MQEMLHILHMVKTAACDLLSTSTEHRAELDDLKTEAKSSESLGQQFKAVALLCMAEYQDQLSSADSSMLAAKNIDGQTLSRPLNETALEGALQKLRTNKAGNLSLDSWPVFLFICKIKIIFTLFSL